MGQYNNQADATKTKRINSEFTGAFVAGITVRTYTARVIRATITLAFLCSIDIW